MIPRICLTCNKKFKVWPYELRLKYGKYCSTICKNKAQKGKHHSPLTEFKKGKPGPWLGKKRPEVLNWLTPIKKGNIPWNKGLSGYLAGDKHYSFNKHRENMMGELNPAWKGGVCPLNEKIRKSIEYERWREAVFKRDNYSCVICGDNTSNNLEADHIKRFSEHPKLRFEISNGRTLCIPCHRKTETYGNHKERAE